MAQTYNVQIEDSEGNKYCPKPDLLTTPEEVEANTDPGKSVDSLVIGDLISNLNGFSFGTTADGKPGYKEAGADAVTPFKTTEIIDLGTGTSFDVSTINGYENFTIDNFIIEINKVSISGYTQTGYAGNISKVSVIQKIYNNSTGILTLSGLSCTQTNTSSSGSVTNKITGTVSVKRVLLVVN